MSLHLGAQLPPGCQLGSARDHTGNQPDGQPSRDARERGGKVYDTAPTGPDWRADVDHGSGTVPRPPAFQWVPNRYLVTAPAFISGGADGARASRPLGLPGGQDLRKKGPESHCRLIQRRPQTSGAHHSAWIAQPPDTLEPRRTRLRRLGSVSGQRRRLGAAASLTGGPPEHRRRSLAAALARAARWR